MQNVVGMAVAYSLNHHEKYPHENVFDVRTPDANMWYITRTKESESTFF